jgi:hypothetical protein
MLKMGLNIGDCIKITKVPVEPVDPALLTRCPSTYGYMNMQFSPSAECIYIIVEKYIYNEYTLYYVACKNYPDIKVGFELIDKHTSWFIRISQVGYEMEKATIENVTT